MILELEFLRTLTCFLVIFCYFFFFFAEVPVLVLGVQHFISGVMFIVAVVVII